MGSKIRTGHGHFSTSCYGFSKRETSMKKPLKRMPVNKSVDWKGFWTFLNFVLKIKDVRFLETAKETLREFAEDGLRTFVTPVETQTFADVSKSLLRFLLTVGEKGGIC